MCKPLIENVHDALSISLRSPVQWTPVGSAWRHLVQCHWNLQVGAITSSHGPGVKRVSPSPDPCLDKLVTQNSSILYCITSLPRIGQTSGNVVTAPRIASAMTGRNGYVTGRSSRIQRHVYQRVHAGANLAGYCEGRVIVAGCMWLQVCSSLPLSS